MENLRRHPKYAHSPNTGEEFNCHVWVIDAILALRQSHLIALHGDIGDMKDSMLEETYDIKQYVEEGMRLT